MEYNEDFCKSIAAEGKLDTVFNEEVFAHTGGGEGFAVRAPQQITALLDTVSFAWIHVLGCILTG